MLKKYVAHYGTGTPCEYPSVLYADTLDTLIAEFKDYVNTYDRFVGNTQGLWMSVCPSSHDYPIMLLTVGPKGGVKVERT